jgi:hypothetical protein
MGKTATKFTERIQVPPAQALRHYGKAVASIMDQKAQSSNRDHAFLNETDLIWRLGFVRGPDSEEITDEADYVKHLASGTIVKLVGQTTNGKWWCEADVDFIPPQIMAKLEAHARRICASRRHQPEIEALEPGLEVVPQQTPIDHLQEWLKQHPRHDKRLSSVTVFALEKLMETG